MPDRERLGRYRILRELGRGGMGVVYQAEDEMLGRPVALKTLQITDADREGLRQRLRREAQLSARLNHANVITLFDMGVEDGLDYLVLEYVEGRTLRDLLNGVGRMRLNEALAIFRDMAEGVGHAHEKGIIHRDLKPENVMVTSDGRAKVMDFGLAWAAYQAKLTQTGAVMGTLAYFSPEQARGQTADERSDLYSLGAILFELLTGELLFTAKSPVEMIMHHLESAPRSIVQLVPSLTPELDAVVKRCLQKDPKNRYQSVRAMLSVLPTAAARPMTPPPALTMPPALAFKSVTQVPTSTPPSASPATGAWGPFQRAMARMGEVVGEATPQPSDVPVPPPPPKPVMPPPSLEPGVDYKSDTFDSQYRKGKSALEERRYEDGIRYLQAACKLNPKESRPYRHLAYAYAKLDRMTEALDACRSGLNIAPDHARMRVLLGDLLAKSGQASQAIGEYERALKLRPDLVEAWRPLMKLALAADRVSDAVKACEAVLRADPKDADALRALPGLHLRQMNPGKAEQAARAALKQYPRDSGLHLDLARAMEGQKNPLAAAQILQEAVRLDPSHVGAWERLAALHLKCERPLAARAVLEEALGRHPHNARLNWNVGELWRSEGRTDKAVEMYEQALTFSPAIAAALQQAQEGGDLSRSLEDVRQDTRARPTEAGVWRLHGVIADARGLKEEAVNSFQRALQLDPSDTRSAALLGRLCVRMRQAMPAQEVLSNGLRHAPNDLLLHYLLGQARRQMGNLDGASRSFRRAWERLPKA